jgi:hypothetical protein
MGGIGKSIPPIFYHAFEVPISDWAKTTMPRKKGSGAKLNEPEPTLYFSARGSAPI